MCLAGEPNWYCLLRSAVKAYEEIDMPIGSEELSIRFTYHAPKEGQPDTYTALRKRAHQVALMIDDACPDSREKNLAITKLEEAIMWANAAIARRS
jgi:hypothetical protein